MNDIPHAIRRLEEALERQKEEKGKTAATPDVYYCFECDQIFVDDFWSKGCDHDPIVHSDGYEHDGIRSALVTLRYISAETKH